jgi:hypothetical protein
MVAAEILVHGDAELSHVRKLLCKAQGSRRGCTCLAG